MAQVSAQMSRSLVFRQRARLGIAEAVEWYELRSATLAADFVAEIEAATAAIERNPHQYQKFRGEFRRMVIRRFPYSLVYIATDYEIVIMRCIHHRQNPRRLDDLA
jgi:plasmid stabilization system protein ParE